ncbi:MAG: transposase [Telluria sp.]
MPRRARLVIPGVPMHIIQRGNNRHACFVAHADYLVYLRMLKASAVLTNSAIHAYVLMTNHVHLLLSPPDADSAGRFMKALGQRYASYVNRHYRRTGSLWEGRYRSCIVEDERYLLICHRYIELNPVRAAMVTHPARYDWSSYCANAEGEDNDLITPHEVYMRLGLTPAERRIAYRDLFLETLSEDMLSELRRSTNGNYAFSNGKFAQWTEQMLGRSTSPRKSGRPRAR